MPFDLLDCDAEDPNRAATLRAILAIARELNIAVIAEGVETQEQGEMLVTAGATTHAQGLRQGCVKPLTEQDESDLVDDAEPAF